MGDLDRISLEDCQSFFSRYYAPNNATVYLAGDFEVAPTLHKLTEAYGSLAAGPGAEAVPRDEPEQRGQRRAELLLPAQAPALLLGYRGVAASDGHAPALDLLATLLTHGDGALLVRLLVHRKQLCTEISCDHGWRLDPGVFLFAAELAPEASPKRVEREIVGQLEELASSLVSSPALARARAQLRLGLLRELQTASGRAHALGNAEHLLGSLALAQEQIERIESVTRQGLRDAAETLFKTERSSIVWVDP